MGTAGSGEILGMGTIGWGGEPLPGGGEIVDVKGISETREGAPLFRRGDPLAKDRDRQLHVQTRWIADVRALRSALPCTVQPQPIRSGVRPFTTLIISLQLFFASTFHREANNPCGLKNLLMTEGPHEPQPFSAGVGPP